MSHRRHEPDVVGVTEVAELSGRTRSAISQWQGLPPAGMPRPTLLAGGPVWDRRAMIEWLESTGRLSSEHRSATL